MSLTCVLDERFFANPDAFIPERWTSEPKLVKDVSVFAPFSVGTCDIFREYFLQMLRAVTQGGILAWVSS